MKNARVLEISCSRCSRRRLPFSSPQSFCLRRRPARSWSQSQWSWKQLLKVGVNSLMLRKQLETGRFQWSFQVSINYQHLWRVGRVGPWMQWNCHRNATFARHFTNEYKWSHCSETNLDAWEKSTISHHHPRGRASHARNYVKIAWHLVQHVQLENLAGIYH